MAYSSVAISYLPKGNYLYETNTSSMKLLLNIIVCGAVLSSSFAVAQEKDKWDVNNPPGPYKEHSFSVNEGTWLNLDVSPDGQKIVFDILGDIYVMPITGGTACNGIAITNINKRGLIDKKSRTHHRNTAE